MERDITREGRPNPIVSATLPVSLLIVRLCKPSACKSFVSATFHKAGGRVVFTLSYIDGHPARVRHPAKPVSTDTESGATRPQAGSVLHTGARIDVHRPGSTLPILPTEGRGRLRSGASAPKFRSFAFRTAAFAQDPHHPGPARQALTIVFRPQKGRAIFASWDGQT